MASLGSRFWAWITFGRFVRIFVGANILYIGFLILSPFPDYIPPNLSVGFLRDKGEFFWSTWYCIGFFAHITTAPPALLVGMLGISRTIRQWYPRFHRSNGKIYVLLVLLGAAPGGLIMATRAFGGFSSQLCFTVLSVLLWIATYKAWRNAVMGNFRSHAEWMSRSCILMCSAVLLRLISLGLANMAWSREFRYQLAVWLSWVPALVFVEFWLVFRRKKRLKHG